MMEWTKTTAQYRQVAPLATEPAVPHSVSVCKGPISVTILLTVATERMNGIAGAANRAYTLVLMVCACMVPGATVNETVLTGVMKSPTALQNAIQTLR